MGWICVKLNRDRKIERGENGGFAILKVSRRQIKFIIASVMIHLMADRHEESTAHVEVV